MQQADANLQAATQAQNLAKEKERQAREELKAMTISNTAIYSQCWNIKIRNINKSDSDKIIPGTMQKN